jgi:hypothetical protein
MTVHNPWLPKTHSIPYWTTSVFSSTVIDFVLHYKSVTSSTATALNASYLMNESFFSARLPMLSRAYPWKMFFACTYPWKLFVDPLDIGSEFHTKSVSTNRHLHRTCICELLCSNGLFRLSGFMSHCS